MPNKTIWRLVLLWPILLVFKIALWEQLGFLIVRVLDSSYPLIFPVCQFIGATLFPILYAVWVWRLFWRYRMSYRAVEGMLYLLLSAAVVFALSSICWTVTGSPRVLPFSLLAPLTLIEMYGCASFICLFIAFFFLGFGRRRSPA